MSLPKIKEVQEALKVISEKYVLVNDQVLSKETGNPVHTWTSKSTGYTKINMECYKFLYHRIVFFLHTGLWPDIVDHKDRDKTNNHPSNLRAATSTQNNQNRKPYKGSSSKFKGVSFHKGCNKWQSRITFNGAVKHIGYYDTEEDAAQAYDIYALICFREFSVLNHPDVTADIMEAIKIKFIKTEMIQKLMDGLEKICHEQE